jgi:hypothetical protein
LASCLARTSNELLECRLHPSSSGRLLASLIRYRAFL